MQFDPNYIKNSKIKIENKKKRKKKKRKTL